MLKPPDPKRLAIDILARSTCAVQVGAAITDATGRIISWGWNHAGASGYGTHAEHHAISRANRGRLHHGIIYVASKRRKNGKVVESRPCAACFSRIVDAGIISIFYRNKNGAWEDYFG